MSPSSFIMRWVLPAAAGIACASLLVPIGTPASPATNAMPGTKEDTTPLPDDPAMIQLATLAGRTTEARSKIAELIAAGAKDDEIATWLAPLLVADPAWLEKFILTVPEARRIDLVRETFKKMAEVHVDSVWELIRVSPAAALAARSAGSDPRYTGLDGIGISRFSSLAADVLFDPAHGFELNEVTRFFRHGAYTRENSKRILEEWLAGRWEGATPDCVKPAWYNLRKNDPAAFQVIEEKLSPEMRARTAEFKASSSLFDFDAPPRTDYRAEELEGVGADGLATLVEKQAMSSAPIPLDTLAQLPEKVRGEALANYFDWLYPFETEMAREALGKLDTLGFTKDEKQALLDSALAGEWSTGGDFEWSMKIVRLMPEGESRTKAERELLEDYARDDPAGTLEFTGSMPEGELRTRIEKLATDNQP
jgi:hypothetical protein